MKKKKKKKLNFNLLGICFNSNFQKFCLVSTEDL